LVDFDSSNSSFFKGSLQFEHIMSLDIGLLSRELVLAGLWKGFRSK